MTKNGLPPASSAKRNTGSSSFYVGGAMSRTITLAGDDAAGRVRRCAGHVRPQFRYRRPAFPRRQSLPRALDGIGRPIKRGPPVLPLIAQCP
jgi:hypothetical protein